MEDFLLEVRLILPKESDALPRSPNHHFTSDFFSLSAVRLLEW